VTVVTGLAHLVLDAETRVDVRPWLRERKSKKYMGLQDELAVACAGLALKQAGLAEHLAGERTGLFIAVGYIPFRESDILPVLEGSLDERGQFDMRRFAQEGYLRAHPLLAFRCLPNMPAYHVAANFGIEGPYFVGYPDAGQLYLALDQANEALADGRIDVALVCGVAHQRNLLVEHHFARVEPPVAADRLFDAAAAIVLERPDHAVQRSAQPLGELQTVDVSYHPHDPLVSPRDDAVEAWLGPAGPLIALAHGWESGASLVEHHQRVGGIEGRCRWQRSAP
jgi:3-oxoacyl-(acyl-carrier-protein) synthase